jgi:hypothetical protein
MVYAIPGSRNLEGAEIALASCYMYYSWQNINAQPLNNNQFQIFIPPLTVQGDGTGISALGNRYYTITIPDGIYTIADLDNFLQQWSIDNDFYLVDSAGNNVYFFQLSANITQYNLQFNTFVFPSLNAGQTFASAYPTYTQPPNGFMATLVSGSSTGTFVSTVLGQFAAGFLFPANFSTFAGFPDNYVASTTGLSYFSYGVTTDPTLIFPSGVFSFTSTVTPQVQPNPVIFLNCNLVMNTFSTPNTFLAPIPGKTSAGGLLTIEPPEYAWNKVIPGQSGQIILSFTQTDGQPIIISDPDIVVTLIIREHTDKHFNMGPSNTFGGPSSASTARYALNPQNNGSDGQHTALARKFNR